MSGQFCTLAMFCLMPSQIKRYSKSKSLCRNSVAVIGKLSREREALTVKKQPCGGQWVTLSLSLPLSLPLSLSLSL